MGSTLEVAERDFLQKRLEQISGESPFNVLHGELLSELAKMEVDHARIISLYLDLSPQYRLKNAWAVALKSLTKDALEREDESDREAVEAELEEIERWLEENISRLGRGVAIFSCEKTGLARRIRLPVALPNRLEVGRRPHLRPLLRVRDEHDLYVVVLLDKRRARLFLSQHGTLYEVFDMFEDTPGHQKQGGWSQMRFQRHHDAHVLWHAGAVAHATNLLLEHFRGSHLLVSGTDEVLAEYREHLGPAEARLDGAFAVAIDASEHEIAEAIEPLLRTSEARAEEEMIETIHDSVSSGRGVWGLDKTLRALTEQRVMTLVVADSFRSEGAECLHCGLLSAQREGECPSCGEQLRPVDDVVDLALERAVGQQATLELVRSQKALGLLDGTDSIGARLRF